MKLFLKTFALLLLLSCGNNNIKTDFALLPENKYNVKGTVSDEKPATGTVFIKTNSVTKKIYCWKKTLDTCPKEWHIYYCDNVSCYFIMPDSSEMHGIDVNMKDDENRMKLYVESNGKPGSGIVKIAVYDKTNRSLTDTITYSIHIIP